jgi:hypothetical protein
MMEVDEQVMFSTIPPMDEAVPSYWPQPMSAARRALTLAESVELRRLYDELPVVYEAAYAAGAQFGTRRKRFKLLDDRVNDLSERIAKILNG